MSAPSDFLIKSAIAELQKLQAKLALERGVLREQRRAWWEPDRHWQVRKFHAINETKARIAAAERALADFIRQHREFLGPVPKNGRLCWHAFLGGQPINIHYCQLPEGHTGPHQNSLGKWTGKPKHPEKKTPQPIPSLIMAENAKNRAKFGSEWGKRTGPSILLYRSGNRQLRSHSCLGCAFLYYRDESALCAHPEMLRKHQVPQFVANHGPKLIVNLCPVINREEQLTQPYWHRS